MNYTTFNTQDNPLLALADFNSFHISHDGEGDDIQSLVFASLAFKNDLIELSGEVQALGFDLPKE